MSRIKVKYIPEEYYLKVTEGEVSYGSIYVLNRQDGEFDITNMGYFCDEGNGLISMNRLDYGYYDDLSYFDDCIFTKVELVEED